MALFGGVAYKGFIYSLHLSALYGGFHNGGYPKMDGKERKIPNQNGSWLGVTRLKKPSELKGVNSPFLSKARHIFREIWRLLLPSLAAGVTPALSAVVPAKQVEAVL